MYRSGPVLRPRRGIGRGGLPAVGLGYRPALRIEVVSVYYIYTAAALHVLCALQAPFPPQNLSRRPSSGSHRHDKCSIDGERVGTHVVREHRA